MDPPDALRWAGLTAIAACAPGVGWLGEARSAAPACQISDSAGCAQALCACCWHPMCQHSSCGHTCTCQHSGAHRTVPIPPLHPLTAPCWCAALAPADPLSGQPLSSDALVPNLVLRDMIHAWLQEDPASSSNASSDSSSGSGQCADSSAGPAAAPAAVSRGSSPSKDRKAAGNSGSDRDAVRDAMLPSTPVRTSRDV